MTDEILRLLRDIRRGIDSQWGPGGVGWESIAHRIDTLFATPPGWSVDPLDVAKKCWEDVRRSDPQKATQLFRAEIERCPGLLQKALEFAATEWLYRIGMPPPTTNFAEKFTPDSSK